MLLFSSELKNFLILDRVGGIRLRKLCLSVYFTAIPLNCQLRWKSTAASVFLNKRLKFSFEMDLQKGFVGKLGKIFERKSLSR